MSLAGRRRRPEYPGVASGARVVRDYGGRLKRIIAVVVVSGTIAPACGRSVPVNTSAPTQCEQLAAVKLENTTIDSAERITRGAFTAPGARDSLASLPPFCRVTGEIRPTTDSHIAFEVWMPLENWSGKFVGVGNGGWAGVISYGPLAEELRRGYATVSTNTGHVAEPGSTWRSSRSATPSVSQTWDGDRYTR